MVERAEPVALVPEFALDVEQLLAVAYKAAQHDAEGHDAEGHDVESLGQQHV